MAVVLPDDVALQHTASGGFDLRGEASSLRVLAHDLWRCRQLIGILSKKDFVVRYRRATFGLTWAVALPLLQAIVIGVVLQKFIPFKTSGGNYVAFAFAGTVAWQFFGNGFTGGTGSIIDNSGVSSKIYFPRAVFPIVSVLSNAYGLAISVVALLLLAVSTGSSVGPQTLLLVPAMVVLLAFTITASATAAALQVYFRDVKWIVTAALIPWFYLTPIIYPLDAKQVSSVHRWVLLNPVTGIVELFRAGTVGADHGWTVALWSTLGWGLLLLAASVLLHRRFDRVFADLL